MGNTNPTRKYLPLYQAENPKTTASGTAPLLRFTENPEEGYSLAEAITIVLVCEADAVGDENGNVLFDRERCERLIDLAWLLEGQRHLPAELLDRKQWVIWRAEWNPDRQKFTKPPRSARTGEKLKGEHESAERTSHYVTFNEALAAALKHDADGVGFSFTKGDPYVGIDFDDCLENGIINKEVHEWLKNWFNSTYVEISPSGTGIHAIAIGKLAKNLTSTSLPHAGSTKVEMYDHARFFTVTGRQLGASTKVRDCQVSITKLLSYLTNDSSSDTQQPTAATSPCSFTASWVCKLYADTLDKLRATKEGNGNNFLNDAALIAARVHATKLFDKTEEQFKRELLDIVTKEWERPHPEQGAHDSIGSGWRKGTNAGPYPLEPEVATAEELKRPDMPATVLSGRLGQWCRERLADFPVAYSWPALLAAASARVTSSVGARCNIYTVLVGKVHSGKSMAIDSANFLMNLEAEKLLLNEKFGSAEGLLEGLGERGTDAVLWSPDELSHLLEKAQIQNASFPTILNSMFYHDRNDATVAHRKHIACNARVSLIGGIVEENFGDSFGTATTTGFYDRCLFGLFPDGNFRYLYRPIEGAPLVKLNSIPAGLFAPPNGQPLGPRVKVPVIDKSVWDERDEIIKQEGIDARVAELAIRAALICAAWDEKDVLTSSGLQPHWELARYQQRVRNILQPNPGRNFEAMAAHKILNYVKDHSVEDKWLEWRAICRATHVMEFGPSVASRALSELIFARELEEAKIKPASGPAKRLIRLLKD